MLQHKWIVAATLLSGTLAVSAVAQAGIIQDEADFAVFNTSSHYLYPATPDTSLYDEPVGGNDKYIYAYPFNETGNTVSQYTWTPGLTGTFNVDASWAVGATHAAHAEYFFDADGAGPIAEIPLLPPGVYGNQTLYADGTSSGATNWSGFLEIGSGLNLNSASVFRTATSTAGEYLTAGVWQFSAVPEPASGTLCLFGAIGTAIWMRSRGRREGQSR